MAQVRVQELVKRFGGVCAVDHVSLTLEDGHLTVLVGPSGCGKTTLLRIIAGLEEPTEGEVYIGDMVVNDVPPWDRNIAMVFQSYALYPHMSVFDNIAFPLQARKVPKEEIKKRVEQTASLLGLSELLQRKPRQLSGGQMQRVALGRAIVRKPEVFLMDEPLSNLDAKLRVQTRAELSKLHQRLETTFIYVTHDQMEAMTMGTRICVLRDGILQQVDTPQNLYQRPDNIFVAGFIGSPAMNFFDVTLVGTKEEMYVDGGTFRVKLPPEKARPLGDYLGKQVIFGVRPEDIHDRQYAPPGITAAPLTAKVDVTELMGNEIFVYLLTGQKSFIARVDPRTRARVGQDLDIVMNMDNVHIFDKQTERAIRQ